MKSINFQDRAPTTAVARRGNGTATLRVTRALGALSLLAVGGVHFEQYTVAHFSVVPTIGSLFLANFIAATTIGLILLLPIRATVGWRRLVFDSLAALSGIAVAGGALLALLVSEQTPLFGFMEYGYRREIVIALASEAVAIVSLGIFIAHAARRARRLRAEEHPRRGGGRPRCLDPGPDSQPAGRHPRADRRLLHPDQPRSGRRSPDHRRGDRDAPRPGG